MGAAGRLSDLTNLVITILNMNGVKISDTFVKAIKQRYFRESKAAKLKEVWVNYVAVNDVHIMATSTVLFSDGLRGRLKFAPT